MSWKANPLIYEINTWTWLDELSRKYQRPVTLANIPTMEWDALADLGFAAVWLMGVWERSPAGRLIAMENQAMLAEFRALLPDYQPRDLLGSAYCVRRYTADRRLGGTKRPGCVPAGDVRERIAPDPGFRAQPPCPRPSLGLPPSGILHPGVGRGLSQCAG